MQAVKIESDKITLPPEVIRKLRGKQVQFIEFQSGFILKPVSDSVRSARGILKNKRFSTERYFQIKQQDKELEK